MKTTQQTDSDRALEEVAAAVRSVPSDVLDEVAAMLAGAGTVAAYAGGREGLDLVVLRVARETSQWSMPSPALPRQREPTSSTSPLRAGTGASVAP
jgi:hypothetical protein